MKIEVLADADSVARAAAAVIAAEARAAAAARGRFLVAFSGGKTPWVMLRALADEDVPWRSVHVFQVDERVAPEGHPDRNLTHLSESLLAHAPLPPGQLHAMPVESPDLEAAARYARTLEEHRAARPSSTSSTSGSDPTGTPRRCPGRRRARRLGRRRRSTGTYLASAG